MQHQRTDNSSGDARNVDRTAMYAVHSALSECIQIPPAERFYCGLYAMSPMHYHTHSWLVLPSSLSTHLLILMLHAYTAATIAKHASSSTLT
jgi:hypothetical protein